jgi:hypothetical protein
MEMDKALLSVAVSLFAIGSSSGCGGNASTTLPYGPVAGASTGAISGVGGVVITAAGNISVGNGGAVTVGTTASAGGAGGKTAMAAAGALAGGKGGTTTTSKAGSGGSTSAAGKGGSTTATAGKGGFAGSGTGGASGSTGSIFTKAYSSSCTGDLLLDVNHFGDRDCLSMGCHSGWAFAGTVWQSNGSTGARNVEIGVKSGSNFYSICTGQSGGLFALRSGRITWGGAKVAIRNAKGEKSSMHSGGNLSGSCNAGGTCHGSDKLIEP